LTPQSNPVSGGARPAIPAERLVIAEERGLIRHRKAITSRLQAHPDAMRMLILNPVLAFREAGIDLTPAVANHVLHAIQYPHEVRAERDRLEAELKATLGRPARPTDPKWLAQTVFGPLGITPVDHGDAEPVYRSSFDAESITRLQALLPTRGVVTVPAPNATPSNPTPLPFQPRTVQLLDLDALVPPLPAAPTAPAELSLVDLWFYKDASPSVRSLLSLGIIISSGVAIYSSSQYRKIRDGDTTSEILSWITAVKVPSTKPTKATKATKK
jgi:hypothetical protein